MMTPQQKITTALLAAKLAKSALELLAVHSAMGARLCFQQILADVKVLDDHIKTL